MLAFLGVLFRHRKRSNFRSLFEFFPMPRTVLVVDDERDTNDILANLVQTRGFEPIQVFSGQQALAVIAEKKPDLILLDLMLPDMTVSSCATG